MGVTDFFYGPCPNCGHEIGVGTKLFMPRMIFMRPGDNMSKLRTYEEIMDMTFRVDPDIGSCTRCRYVPTVKIRDGVFEGFE